MAFFGDGGPKIDELMAGLYLPGEELELRCVDSIKGASNDENKRNSLKTSDIIVKKSVEAVLETLNEDYFTSNFDPVDDLLAEISQWGVQMNEDVTARFMNKIEEVDVDKDIVVGRLLYMIQLNYNSLMSCMRDINAIDIDLTKAIVQVKNSRKKLTSADDKACSGLIKVSQLQSKVDRLNIVSETLKSIKELKNVYNTMNNCVTTGDVGLASEYSYSLLTSLQDECYSKMTCLDDMRRSMQNHLYRIRYKTDKALMRLCSRKFSSVEYDNIVKSYVMLNLVEDSLGLVTMNPNPEDSGDEDIQIDSLGCLEGMPMRIQRFLVDDVGVCLRTAILEFIYASQHKKQKAAERNDVLESFAPIDVMGMVDLAEGDIKKLCECVSADMTAQSIVRSCELLCDVVHTHYMMSQWHRSPFNPRSHDNLYMHGTPISDVVLYASDFHEGDADAVNPFDSDEESTAVESEADSKKSTSINIELPVELQDQRILSYSNKLQYLFENITNCRLVLWHQLQSSLIEVVSCAKLSASVSIDDFLAVAWSIQLMCKLGEEFTGSHTASKGLRSCFEVKQKEYVVSMYTESFNIIKQMLSAESWHSVTIRLGEVGGVLGLIKLNSYGSQSRVTGLLDKIAGTRISSVDALVNQSESVEAAGASTSILMMYGSYGNPLHFMTDADTDVVESSDHSTRSGVDGDSDYIPIMKQKRSVDVLMDQPSAAKGANVRSSFHFETSVLFVTQTSLNGLARYTGRFLELMHILPSSSPEIFEGLCHLFNVYMGTIFNCFIPDNERQRVLGKNNSKMTNVSPDQAREFEALHTYINGLYDGTNQNGHILYFHTVDGVRDETVALNKSISDTLQVTTLLQSIQEVQGDPSNFYSIHERIVAAESCWFAAKLLNETKAKFTKLLPESYVVVCNTYIAQYHSIASQLQGMIYRTMSPQLITQSTLVPLIIDSPGWDSKKPREQPHDWVDLLVFNCRHVWEYLLSQQDSAETSELVREQLWIELCQSAFDTVIEAYSKLRKTTTQGRALMSLNVSALHNALDAIHSCRPPRGKHHIDNYIRAFYMSETDMLQWINENWMAYCYRHIHGLLTQTMSSLVLNKKFKDAVAMLDTLYDYADDKPSSTLFNMRFNVMGSSSSNSSGDN